MSRTAITYSAMPPKTLRASRVSLYQPPFPRLPHISTRSVFKRLLDVVGALVGLAILSVLFVPVAIAIRLDSPPPPPQGQFSTLKSATVCKASHFGYGNFALWSAMLTI